MEHKNPSIPIPPDHPPSLGRLLNFSAGAMNRLCQAMLAEHDLSLAQWVTLSALWKSDGLLINDLAGYAGSHAPAASRLIDRMESAGLVQRRADASDGRAVRVHLTDKGRELRTLSSFHATVNEKLLAGFDQADRDALFAMLERVIVNSRTALELQINSSSHRPP